jgi:hypothetical protein
MRRRSIPRQGGQVGTVNGRQKAGANHAPSRIQKSPLGNRFFGLSMNRSIHKRSLFLFRMVRQIATIQSKIANSGAWIGRSDVFSAPERI